MCTRRLLINTVHNMRELGGYATADGRTTSWRQFIRSDAPLDMTEADVKTLYDYGVRTVVDLRQSDEAKWRPTLLYTAEGFTHRNIPFTDDFSIIGDVNYCPKDHLVPAMQSKNHAAEILRTMANCDGAVLFYCFMGKDRTGIISALLLMLAGVPAVDVMADYQVTYNYIRQKISNNERDAGNFAFLEATGLRQGERSEHLRRTEPEWLMPFIEFIESFAENISFPSGSGELGSAGASAYLRHIGLTGGEIALLREKLLA